MNQISHFSNYSYLRCLFIKALKYSRSLIFDMIKLLTAIQFSVSFSTHLQIFHIFHTSQALFNFVSRQSSLESAFQQPESTPQFLQKQHSLVVFGVSCFPMQILIVVLLGVIVFCVKLNIIWEFTLQMNVTFR